MDAQVGATGPMVAPSAKLVNQAEIAPVLRHVLPAEEAPFNSRTGTWRNDPGFARTPVALIAERNRRQAPVLLDLTSAGGNTFPRDD